jgi:hypothetical protein
MGRILVDETADSNGGHAVGKSTAILWATWRDDGPRSQANQLAVPIPLHPRMPNPDGKLQNMPKFFIVARTLKPVPAKQCWQSKL